MYDLQIADATQDGMVDCGETSSRQPVPRWNDLYTPRLGLGMGRIPRTRQIPPGHLGKLMLTVLLVRIPCFAKVKLYSMHAA